MRKCCVQADLLEVQPVRTIQRYDFSNHINWLIEGKPGGNNKFSQCFPNVLSEQYKESLERTGLGNTLWGVFR